MTQPTPPVPPDPRDLMEAFDTWVLFTTHDDEVQVPVHLDATHVRLETVPAATLTWELADQVEPLRESVGVALRLPVSATYAHAARLLWCLREDDAFACDSYGEAVRRLQSMPSDRFGRYWHAVDVAITSMTTTLPTWPQAA